MATSILLKFLTLKCDISRTIWRIEVSDGSLFCIFHALSFELNLFFDRTSPLKFIEVRRQKSSFRDNVSGRKVVGKNGFIVDSISTDSLL